VAVEVYAAAGEPLPAPEAVVEEQNEAAPEEAEAEAAIKTGNIRRAS
jgi:hypothetical protein